MRMLVLAVLATLPALSTPSQAQMRGDPYPWCAEYRGGRGGGTNCYFSTIQQCQAAVSGNGGFCRQNAFFNGRPVTTPEDRPMRRSRS